MEEKPTLSARVIAYRGQGVSLREMTGAVEPYTLALCTQVLDRAVELAKTTIEKDKKGFAMKECHLYVKYHFVTASKS